MGRYNAAMHQALKPHPDSLVPITMHVDVDVRCPRSGGLILTYAVAGPISDVRVPPAAAASRADKLWQHTCFEAFVGASPDAAYYEFNFSPSTEWAVYRFDGYRSGMRVATEIGVPPIQVQSSPDRYTLQATLDLDGLSGLPRDAAWRLGLAAVIEDSRGRMAYWALAHPPGKPDFHHSQCFAHELSSPVLP
jgi:hypothetical protein